MGDTYGVKSQGHLVFDAVLLAEGFFVLQISQRGKVIGRIRGHRSHHASTCVNGEELVI